MVWHPYAYHMAPICTPPVISHTNPHIHTIEGVCSVWHTYTYVMSLHTDPYFNIIGGVSTVWHTYAYILSPPTDPWTNTIERVSTFWHTYASVMSPRTSQITPHVPRRERSKVCLHIPHACMSHVTRFRGVTHVWEKGFHRTRQQYASFAIEQYRERVFLQKKHGISRPEFS